MTPSDPTAPAPLIIATILREEGNTGVQTHVRQLRQYLLQEGTRVPVVTPFSRNATTAAAVFAVRPALSRLSGPAGVVWYRHWHELFLRKALRRSLAEAGPCTVYAQEPVAARAALRARRGPHQRVVMAVHFRTSQADEWAGKGEIRQDGTVFRGIRALEQAVIPEADGLVYVSEWARRALVGWLPAAGSVRSAVIGNFVAAASDTTVPNTTVPNTTGQGPQADLVTTGHLEPVKNHRYLLQVLAAANERGHRLTLDVFGEGPLLGELRELARSLAVVGQVRFRGFQRNVRDYLPEYRAYVHASYSESSSLAIMEAMAAGLPVVAGNIGPIGELCDDGAEARFWPLDDPARAAATLLTLLGDESARSSAARAASARFQHDFDAKVVAPRLVSFLLGAASVRADSAR
jgi:glycosyltransferase involved in cell wall biosynthesis